MRFRGKMRCGAVALVVVLAAACNSLSVDQSGVYTSSPTQTITGEIEVADDDTLASLYETLEHRVLPLYYRDPQGFAAVRRHSIARNGPMFSCSRTVLQYLRHAYRPARGGSASGAPRGSVALPNPRTL